MEYRWLTVLEQLSELRSHVKYHEQPNAPGSRVCEWCEMVFHDVRFPILPFSKRYPHISLVTEQVTSAPCAEEASGAVPAIPCGSEADRLDAERSGRPAQALEAGRGAYRLECDAAHFSVSKPVTRRICLATDLSL